MAYLRVLPGQSVHITSSREAKANQRYEVLRQVGDDLSWVFLDVTPGGESRHYEPLEKLAMYHIRCSASLNPNEWLPSRERVSARKDGNKTITKVECEDYWSTDNDWNDMIVIAEQK